MSFKILKNNCCGLDVHKTWIYACIGITDSFKRTEYKQARFSSFTKGLQELCLWLAKYNCIDVCMESTGKYWIPVFNVLEKNNIFVTLSHPKYTKPQKGNKTDRKDAKWICDLYMCGMVKPSFIPPADIRQLRDLVRYRFKLTCMITGEKNRAHNCLTVSNLKLDDVFSDIFGKSSRSITEQILQHPGEVFDVAPFVDSRCKTPIEEIQAAVDGAISHEQAVKLRQCLKHIDELNVHIKNLDEDIDNHMNDEEKKATSAITEIGGIAGASAKAIISVIGTDMSRFPTDAHISSWAGLCPGNNESAKKRYSGKTNKGNRLLRTTLIVCAHAAAKMKNTYFSAQFHRISAHRGKKRAYVAVAHSMLIAIYHILKDGVKYQDLGADYYNQFNKERKINAYLKKLKELGWTEQNAMIVQPA